MLTLGILASGACPAQVAEWVVRGIHPEVPRPFETVTLRFSLKDCSGWPKSFRVEYVAGEIRVRLLEVYPGICGLALDLYNSVEVRLGAFPEGTYAVFVDDIAIDSGSAIPRFAPQRLSFRVEAPSAALATAPPVPRTDFSGHWWNPDESGWGMTVTQSASGQMFVAFFAYDASGAPTWYVAPGGTWANPQSWQGTLYRASGPGWGAFVGGTFDPADVVRTPVGTLQLSFHGIPTAFENPDFGAAYAQWRIDGAQAGRTIRRMPF